MESNHGKVVCIHFAIFGVKCKSAPAKVSFHHHNIRNCTLIELLAHKSGIIVFRLVHGLRKSLEWLRGGFLFQHSIAEQRMSLFVSFVPI